MCAFRLLKVIVLITEFSVDCKMYGNVSGSLLIVNVILVLFQYFRMHQESHGRAELRSGWREKHHLMTFIQIPVLR